VVKTLNDPHQALDCRLYTAACHIAVRQYALRKKLFLSRILSIRCVECKNARKISGSPHEPVNDRLTGEPEL